MALESIHVRGPELTEWSQPVIQLLKWFRSQSIKASLCVHSRFHEPGVAQHPEVL